MLIHHLYFTLLMGDPAAPPDPFVERLDRVEFVDGGAEVQLIAYDHDDDGGICEEL